jgi:hypothetical protein
MTPFCVDLAAVALTGAGTQIYYDTMTAGSGTTTPGSLKREPIHGVLHSLEIEPDGTNGGELEVWDMNGTDGGANVDTASVVTNAQIAAAIAAGKGRLIYSQKFTGSTGSVVRTVRGNPMPFQHGLVARFKNSGPTGTVSLNLLTSGLCRKIEIAGA